MEGRFCLPSSRPIFAPRGSSTIFLSVIETEAQPISVGIPPLFIALEDRLQAIRCDTGPGIRN